MESSVSNNVLIPSGTTGLPKAAYNDHSRFLDIIDHHCNDYDGDFFGHPRFYMGSNMATFGCGVTTEDRIYTTMPM